MEPLVSGFRGKQRPTSYVHALEGILAYERIARMEGQRDEDITVYMCELFTGGFEVNTGTFDHHEGVGDEPGHCQQFTCYVTVKTARRMLEAGVARYSGYEESFEAAVARMEDHHRVRDPEVEVLAYGHYHPALSFEEASALVEGYREYAKEDNSEAYVSLAPTTTGYEIVASSDTGMLGDSDYVSDTVAQRLVDAGLADYMIMG